MTPCIDQKPTEAGNYCIMLRGVRTFLPIFASFDGKDWDWDSIDRRLAPWSHLTRADVYWFPEDEK